MSGIWVAPKPCPRCGLRFRVPNGSLCYRCHERISADIRGHGVRTILGPREAMEAA